MFDDVLSNNSFIRHVIDVTILTLLNKLSGKLKLVLTILATLAAGRRRAGNAASADYGRRTRSSTVQRAVRTSPRSTP